MTDISDLLPGIEVRRGEPMSAHTSFKIGGAVDAMVFPKSEGELVAALRALRGRGIDPLIVGNGTNLLVSDNPRGVVAVKTVPGVGELRAEGERSVRASCGVTLARAAAFAGERALAGLEFAHGIPGSVGGAVFMNAGAYGGEVGGVVRSVTALTKSGEIAELSRGECGFSYRRSGFPEGNLIVLSVIFDLSEGNPEDIQRNMQNFAEQRREKQPLELPSAGSAFKRPKSGYAATLIDEAGLKGYRVGGAAVSRKHAGFIVNLGGASFGDVLSVMEHVRETVFLRTGIELEPEVRVIL
ncbi:MAG: UDP-N-acetylmuramate dehydrogenase [Oscillospiraceae bacterium]|jgi:UDP-N-acetylmuramate dehydrogenase|nr:UDP-N-acetylmuramate dehydrogenase [Oscillospiraceae bacterium]